MHFVEKRRKNIYKNTNQKKSFDYERKRKVDQNSNQIKYDSKN